MLFVSIPFKRESISEQNPDAAFAIDHGLVSIPFKRESISEQNSAGGFQDFLC